MKKLTLCAIAVSGLFAAQANAGDVQLAGYVPAVCEVTGLNTQLLDFGSVATANQTVTYGLNIQCNDGDGATITMTSAEGGLESDDVEDYAIAYDAVLSPAGLTDLTLNAPGGIGTNGTSNSASYGGSGLLATGISATLDIETQGAAPWSGGYSDTLTVQISAN